MSEPVHKPGHLSRGGWPSNDPLCDQCGRWRNRGDHRACSLERKRLNEVAEAEAKASAEAGFAGPADDAGGSHGHP